MSEGRSSRCTPGSSGTAGVSLPDCWPSCCRSSNTILTMLVGGTAGQTGLVTGHHLMTGHRLMPGHQPSSWCTSGPAGAHQARLNTPHCLHRPALPVACHNALGMLDAPPSIHNPASQPSSSRTNNYSDPQHLDLYQQLQESRAASLDMKHAGRPEPSQVLHEAALQQGSARTSHDVASQPGLLQPAHLATPCSQEYIVR